MVCREPRYISAAQVVRFMAALSRRSVRAALDLAERVVDAERTAPWRVAEMSAAEANQRRLRVLFHLATGRFDHEESDLRKLYDRSMAAGDYETAHRIDAEVCLRRLEGRMKPRPFLKLVTAESEDRPSAA